MDHVLSMYVHEHQCGRVFTYVLSYLGIDLGSSEELPQELLALKFFKAIVPYAFQQLTNITTSTEIIDRTLADLLTGIENQDKFAQLSGIKFRTYPFTLTRVC